MARPNGKLRRQDFPRLFEIIDAPCTHFDCGKVCGAQNEGIPVCCDHTEAVPVLHQAEWQWLRQESDMWRPFRPRYKVEERLADDLSEDYRLAVCTGIEHCDRIHRGLVCRQFPFHPYIDRQGRFTGMSYHHDFADRCVLIGRPDLLNPDYVVEFFRAFDYVFRRDPSEFTFAREESIKLRRIFTRKGQKPVIVVRPGYRPSDLAADGVDARPAPTR